MGGFFHHLLTIMTRRTDVCSALTLVSGEGTLGGVVEHQLEAFVGRLELAGHLVDEAQSQVHLVRVHEAGVGVQHVLQSRRGPGTGRDGGQEPNGGSDRRQVRSSHGRLDKTHSDTHTHSHVD